MDQGGTEQKNQPEDGVVHREGGGEREDYELTLFDRIEVIKATDKKYDLEHNAYISFSGGKDSTVLSELVDMALPGNKIPRVFINTGIEYLEIVKFVRERESYDKRFIEIRPTKPIKETLERYGYPMKSKEHSNILAVYQRSGKTESVAKYLGEQKSNRKITCPNALRYQFTPEFGIKVSDQCCHKMKKEPARKWERDNARPIAMTGMRSDEGGQRKGIGCVVMEGDRLHRFHPLAPVSDGFEEWIIKSRGIRLCSLYYPPLNFKRTGCRGCPFSLSLQDQLTAMEIYLPQERAMCEYIWKPIYGEYRRIGYRLDKNEQMKLF